MPSAVRAPREYHADNDNMEGAAPPNRVRWCIRAPRTRPAHPTPAGGTLLVERDLGGGAVRGVPYFVLRVGLAILPPPFVGCSDMSRQMSGSRKTPAMTIATSGSHAVTLSRTSWT